MNKTGFGHVSQNQNLNTNRSLCTSSRLLKTRKFSKSVLSTSRDSRCREEIPQIPGCGTTLLSVHTIASLPHTTDTDSACVPRTFNPPESHPKPKPASKPSIQLHPSSPHLTARKMQLPPASVQAAWPTPNYIDPVTHGEANTTINGIFYPLVILVLLLRLYTRVRVSSSFGLNDTLILVALLPATIFFIVSLLAMEVYDWKRHWVSKEVPGACLFLRG